MKTILNQCQVVTYGSDRENISMSLKQIDEATAAGKWPKDRFGTEMCTVVYGTHWGEPTFSDADFESRYLA